MKMLTKALVPASLGCFLLIGSAAFAQDATQAPPADGEEMRVGRFGPGWRGVEDRGGPQFRMQRDDQGPMRGRMGRGPGRRGGGGPGGRQGMRGGGGPGRGFGGRQGMRGRGGPGGGGMLRGLLAHADELGLTDDQQAQIKEIATAARKAAVQLRADCELARIELQELIHADDPDLDAIEGGLKKVAQAQTAARFAQIEAGVNARSVLTDEQQAKIKEFRRGQGGPAGRGGGGPKRGGGPTRGNGDRPSGR